MYNAESKLGFFLSILTQQSLFQKQEAEIILIDSASPQNEYQLFQTLLPQLKQLNIPIVYARSEKERQFKVLGIGQFYYLNPPISPFWGLMK